MITAKEFGKNAKNNGINAPTLDTIFASWLLKINTSEKREYFVQWWEGWYEALDENLSYQTRKFGY